MKFTLKQQDEITMTVFGKSMVESSSDFIEVLYKTFSRISPTKCIDLSPVRELEEENWRLGESNTEHVKKLLQSMEYCDLIDAEVAYAYIIETFLESETISKIYSLDEKDSMGWTLIRELNTKRDYCKRLIAINNNFWK